MDPVERAFRVHPDKIRKAHKRLPRSERRAPGPAPVVGRQTSLALAGTDVARARALVPPGGALAPVIRWAYALGRGVVLDALASGLDRTPAPPLGGPQTAVGIPAAWLTAWGAATRWTGSSCARAAVLIGLEVLEHEAQALGRVELPDERAVSLFAAEHDPDLYQ